MADEKDNNQPMFAIEHIFMKDASFEAPLPMHRHPGQWSPEAKIDLNTQNEKISDDQYEVTVTVTVTAIQDEKSVFVVEVQQAGCFKVANIPEEELAPMLASFCPSILYPYAREAVGSMVNRAGFPPLYLGPVNFDALYQQRLAESKNAEKSA